MVTSDLGACEWFVWDLRRSGLIERGQLDQIVGEFLKRNPRAEAPALAEYLVKQGSLTAFQSERILNGKSQGLVLGPYILLDAIGQGSMGQVYKASSKNDDQKYAVKVLPRRSMWNVRLARRQVRSFSQFQHPAVVPFVDVGTAGGLHYLTWPMVEGETLEHMVQHHGRLVPAQAAFIGVQVAQGLTCCHQNNIFHGLIKPSNIMIGSDGQTRILDFGIGSLLVENEGESLVDTMSTANTLTSGLDCSSPESILEPTNRTPAGDQYSLGCVLYHCLTGRPPFPEGSAVEKMMAHQTKEPDSIKDFAPDCPDGLIAVVSKLMAKTPEGRYTGTDEVVEALEPYLGEFADAASEVQTSNAGRSNSRNSGFGSSPRMNGLSNKQPAMPQHNPAPPSRPAPAPKPAPAAKSMPIPAPTPQYQTNTPPPSNKITPAPVTKSAPPPSPARSTPTPPTRASVEPPRAPNLPSRGKPSLPSRASFQLPPVEQVEAELTPVPSIDDLPLQDLPQGYLDPAALRASAGWVAEAAEQDQSEKKAGFGPVGMIALAATLMVAAFLVAKHLMN